jgi:hypothetical protein
MVEERKQLNVRIPGDIYHKIELDGREKQQIVTAALELYFSSNVSKHKISKPFLKP